MMASIAARCRCCSISVAAGEAAAPDSEGLPMMAGCSDDATDAGSPAEVSTLTTD